MIERILHISFVILLYSCSFSNVSFSQVVPIQPVFQSGHQSEINEVLFQESGEHLISSSIDGTIVVWDLRLGLQRQSIQAHEDGLSDMVLITDNVLVSSASSGECKVWSLPDLTLINEIKIDKGNINALCKISDSTIAIAGSQLHIWNFYDETLGVIEIEKKGDLNSLAYDAKRKILATSGRRENVITFLSTENDFKVVQELIGNAEVLKFNADILLQINRGGEFRHYDLLSRKRKSYSLNEDVNSVTDMARNRDQFAFSTTLGQVLIIHKKKPST
jgi:WD40 repeat protein